MTCHVNFVRSKDAQKQLAQTSLIQTLKGNNSSNIRGHVQIDIVILEHLRDKRVFLSSWSQDWKFQRVDRHEVGGAEIGKSFLWDGHSQAYPGFSNMK